MFYTIYQTTNTVNGKVYVGKHITTNPNDDYLGSGKHLRRAVQKYGREKFTKEVLHVFETEEEMNLKEKELVTEEFCSRADAYNICEGGKGGFGYINGNKTILEARDKKTKSTMFERYGVLVPSQIPSAKEKLSIANSGKVPSPETRRKLSLAQLANPHFLGKKHSPETLAKMRALKIGHGLGDLNPNFGTMWITNGTQNAKMLKTENPPEGWRKGRKMKVS